jgi:hypothetical protein
MSDLTSLSSICRCVTISKYCMPSLNVLLCVCRSPFKTAAHGGEAQSQREEVHTHANNATASNYTEILSYAPRLLARASTVYYLFLCSPYLPLIFFYTTHLRHTTQNSRADHKGCRGRAVQTAFPGH